MRSRNQIHTVMARLTLAWGALIVTACGQATVTPRLHPTDSVPASGSQRPVLKAHMRSGELYLLSKWAAQDGALEGEGTRYTVHRDPVAAGHFRLELDSIVLLETETHGAAFPFGAQVLAVMTTVYSAVSVICLADPKACFGSCPTFYPEGDTTEIPQAEGFSASIARVLEARDVDALYHARVEGPLFAVEMRNEALETHAVRGVRLLVTPRPPGGRVFATGDGRFYPSATVVEPIGCHAPDGDCEAAVRAMDGLEYRSGADSTDLAQREMLELEFPPATGRLGIVIGARNTLLTTFLFYQSLAYLGRRAVEYLAHLERVGPAFAGDAMQMAALLGGIDIEVERRDEGWQHVGTFSEAGPIATDVAVFPFEADAAEGPVRVRLRMAKGNWRLGYVALARLGEPLEPVALEPIDVRRDERADAAALAALRDAERYLVTYPGDRYRIEFAIPPTGLDLELFLESQGYYYEWMRSEWLAEEDLAMASLIMTQPADALRRLAGPYKAREALIERIFWHSRFGR